MEGEQDEKATGRVPWRKPRITGLNTSGPPQCNPAFPQAAVCSSNSIAISAAGCATKSFFS